MISFSGSLKIFLLVDCCDMRKGFNGLYGLVSSSFGEDPRSGALYVFCNRRGPALKRFDVGCDRDGLDVFEVLVPGALSPGQEMLNRAIIGGPCMRVADRDRKKLEEFFSG